jgi:hypothetical protein
MFDFLRRGPAQHLKRAGILLREAHMARVEHEAAAEHHAALAEMYAQRAQRLEREINTPRSGPWPPMAGVVAELDESRVHHLTKTERLEKR